MALYLIKTLQERSLTNMNNYELVAKVAKYVSVVATVYFVGHFGVRIQFAKDSIPTPLSVIEK